MAGSSILGEDQSWRFHASTSRLGRSFELFGAGCKCRSLSDPFLQCAIRDSSRTGARRRLSCFGGCRLDSIRPFATCFSTSRRCKPATASVQGGGHCWTPCKIFFGVGGSYLASDCSGRRHRCRVLDRTRRRRCPRMPSRSRPSRLGGPTHGQDYRARVTSSCWSRRCRPDAATSKGSCQCSAPLWIVRRWSGGCQRSKRPSSGYGETSTSGRCRAYQIGRSRKSSPGPSCSNRGDGRGGRWSAGGRRFGRSAGRNASADHRSFAEVDPTSDAADVNDAAAVSEQATHRPNSCGAGRRWRKQWRKHFGHQGLSGPRSFCKDLRGPSQDRFSHGKQCSLGIRADLNSDHAWHDEGLLGKTGASGDLQVADADGLFSSCRLGGGITHRKQRTSGIHGKDADVHRANVPRRGAHRTELVAHRPSRSKLCPCSTEQKSGRNKTLQPSVCGELGGSQRLLSEGSQFSRRKDQEFRQVRQDDHSQSASAKTEAFTEKAWKEVGKVRRRRRSKSVFGAVPSLIDDFAAETADDPEKAPAFPLPSSSISARGGFPSTVIYGRGSVGTLDSGQDECSRSAAKEGSKPKAKSKGGQSSQAKPDNVGQLPEIRCTELLKAILQLAGGPTSCLGSFIQRSLRAPRAVHGLAPGSDLWPCPLPRWRWTGPQHLSPKRRRRKAFFETRAQWVQHIIGVLNWQTLGHARSPPDHARLGAPMSPQQHAIVERIETMVTHFMIAPGMKLGDLGRAGEKLGNLMSATFQLSSINAVNLTDLQSLLNVVSEELDPYGKTGKKDGLQTAGNRPAESHVPVQQQQCVIPGEPTGYKVGLATSPAKPVIAKRIKWKLGPSFNPLPFLSDPLVHAAYQDPEVLRLPPDRWPHRPKARVHCSKAELLELAAKWDAFGACGIVPVAEIRTDEAVGLFAVSKDAEFDRLIINPTVINSRMHNISAFTKTIAPGHLITMIRLPPDEDLRISSDDLSEYYYTFKVSKARAARNAIGITFEGHELSHLRCFSEEFRGKQVFLCLSTLAMGDGLAVEIAQQSHYNLLRQLGGCMDPKEVLAYRRAIPRGPFYELLTIDDHIGLQRVKKHLPLEQQNTRDLAVFEQANVAYTQVGLTAHPGKRQRQVTTAVVLGAEVDGIAGRVGAPRNRLTLLMFCTAVVVHKQHCTRKILQSLLGCWVHALLFRRCLFAVLESVYHEGQGLPSDTVFRLTAQSINELQSLLLLGPVAQCNLRTHVCPELFVMDASPYGGAICRADLGSAAVEQLWLHSEQRGYYTRLEQGPGIVLQEKGLEGSDLFGPQDAQLVLPTAEPMVSFESEKSEPRMFDCIELFRGQGNWSLAHAAVGLRVHPGIEISAKGIQFGDLSDDGTFHKLLSLASSGTVKEWHAGPPCFTFGTLRRPRLRSKQQPAGFDLQDPFTKEQTLLAVRTAFLLIVALLAGSFVSCEQLGSSVMFELHIFQVLVSLGCQITKFCFCSYGSAFMKPSKWLHNKPWLLNLAGQCNCAHQGNHFVIQGSFTRASRRVFDRRCSPNAVEVYGRFPDVGEAVSKYSASYPKPLCKIMALGSVAAHQSNSSALVGSGASNLTEDEALRPWHEDPDWVYDLCETLPFRELFRYKFKKQGHINCLECRVYKSWLKHCAKKWTGCRVLGLLDSRVTLGAAAKGRSSSKALSHILRSSLGYVIGSDLYPGGIHCRSAWNRADGPSRDRPVDAPSGEIPTWLLALQDGDTSLFDIMVQSSRWTRPVGRWVRLLLLMAGDIEPNPGPPRPKLKAGPRGELSMIVGLSQATVARMDACLLMFEEWLQKEVGWTLKDAMLSAETANLSLRAYGRFCFSTGKPRYHLVYTITAIQHLRPEFRSFLGGAWQVDKLWQLEEPGQCRAVLSAPVVRSIICLAFLWKWHRFGGLVALGCSGMLHPNEFIVLQRRDLIFPSDALEDTRVLYVHIKNPKTSRFARKQHVRIDDASVLLLARLLFESLPLDSKLFEGSIAVFRRQWNACLDHIGIPRRQADRGATPGTLRGSGATQMYLLTEDLQKVAWRGRWARMRTVEYYVQEVAAQLFLHQLPPSVRSKIILLEQHVWTVLQSQFSEFFLAEQERKNGERLAGSFHFGFQL